MQRGELDGQEVRLIRTPSVWRARGIAETTVVAENVVIVRR